MLSLWAAAAIATVTQGAIIKGESTSSATLFDNLATRSQSSPAGPTAKQQDETSDPSRQITWKIKNQSWIDEDTGKSYVELTNTFTAPINADDEITFHVEFTTSQTDDAGALLRDGFECSMSK